MKTAAVPARGDGSGNYEMIVGVAQAEAAARNQGAAPKHSLARTAWPLAV
jgi:hypothetical protein